MSMNSVPENERQFNEMLVERATADRTFSERLLNDPAAAIGELTGKPIGANVVTEEQRQLLTDILGRAAEDDEFRNALIASPDAALERAGLRERAEAVRGAAGEQDARYWCALSIVYVGIPD